MRPPQKPRSTNRLGRFQGQAAKATDQGRGAHGHLDVLHCHVPLFPRLSPFNLKFIIYTYNPNWASESTYLGLGRHTVAKARRSVKVTISGWLFDNRMEVYAIIADASGGLTYGLYYKKIKQEVERGDQR
jgi:hypothetical protein